MPSELTSRPVISCRDLTKTYDLGAEKVRALRDVTFDIARGELVAVMGASGSGKSSLANLLGALDTPTSGRLEIDGREISGMSSDALAGLRSEEIGFVFQQFNLLPRMTALENVMLPLLCSSRGRADGAEIARERLEQVGLGHRLDHRPTRLSGGQQQRVAIARALINDPPIVIADEPTGALDTLTSYEVMELLGRLHARGLTVVLITHEPDIAAYEERVLRFRDGALVEDLRQRPRCAVDSGVEQ